MSTTKWEKELQVAQSSVLRAARLTKRVLSTVSEVSKEDSSPVTVADFAAQALIISILHRAFPDDGFVGEEDAAVLRREAGLRERVYGLFSDAVTDAEEPRCSVDEMLGLIDLGGRGQGGARGRHWVMDPVDGTAAFLRGEQYAVSLALLEDGEEVLGVVACPNLTLDAAGRVRESTVDADGLGMMFCAVRGQGATVAQIPDADARAVPAGRRLEPLAAPADLADAHMVDCALNAATSRAAVQRLAARLGAPFPGTDVWSSHVRYAALVVGGGDVLMRVPSRPGAASCIWDHAGAQLIFRELGGVVTDLDGRPIDFSAGRCLSRNRGLLAARRGVHAAVLALARELMPDN